MQGLCRLSCWAAQRLRRGGYPFGRRSASAEEATLSGTRGPRRAGVGLHISQIEKVSEMILEAMVAEGISWDRSFLGF